MGKYCFLCKIKNESTLFHSTSGGAFYAIAEHFIVHYGAVVYGAAFDENFAVEHIGIHTMEQLPRLQGSKYSQSVIYKTFREVKEYLDNGRWVLYSGTPCQISAVKRYIGNRERLITVDLICYGVASPKIWREYLDTFHRGRKIKSIIFKDKTYGWKNWRTLFTYSRWKLFLRGETNLFMVNYMDGTYVRPACTNCRFKGENRASDIVIGDAWGKGEKTKLNNDKGLSIVFANSNAGEKVLKNIRNNIDYMEVDFEEYIQGNPYYRAIPEFNLNKSKCFFDEYRKSGFEKAYRRYCVPGGIRRIRYYRKLLGGIRYDG